jgi:hypothetical protein
MNAIYRIIISLLILGMTACASNQSTMSATNDEDKDIGLGGTGMLADTGSGLGGTGILGEITGYGSIFVNGIEVEYDNETYFSIDGTAAAQQQLEIGDVVEVLTSDDSKHTQARAINLRHEVVGKVESVDPETFSFTVLGQAVIQSLNKRTLPDVGATVAVSGFRVDEQTIISTRVTIADTDQTVLRTYTELPFSEKTSRWLVQSYVHDDKAVFQLNGAAYDVNVMSKTTGPLKDRPGVKVLQLHKSDSESAPLTFEQVIEVEDMLRGRQELRPAQDLGIDVMPGSIQGTMPGSIQKNTQPSIRGNR